MKIANTEVAGLAGGLYKFFENLGLELFSGLIGSVRARRRELEYKRVTAGAILAGVILGFVAGLLAFGLPALASGSPPNPLGCAIVEILILVPSIGGLLFGCSLLALLVI
jgi:hypothetical protein